MKKWLLHAAKRLLRDVSPSQPQAINTMNSRSTHFLAVELSFTFAAFSPQQPYDADSRDFSMTERFFNSTPPGRFMRVSLSAHTRRRRRQLFAAFYRRRRYHFRGPTPPRD
jgi:hypothetical protein